MTTQYALLAIAAFAFVLGGCSENKDAEGISISVSPGENALIGPGPDSSCLDRTNYLRALAAKPNEPTYLSRSVAGPVLGFNSFRLTWEKKNEILYVQALRITVEGLGIENGKYTVSFNSIEIENLIARVEGLVESAQGNPVYIDSNDPMREVNPVTSSFGRCGLRIGQIPLTDKSDTLPFTATITIELIGTAEDENGNQRFVRARTRARAKYYGS